MFEKLVDWSQNQFHSLPWRQNRSLYTTLVSEIMLQQTTVGTVLNHFEKFLIEYPTLFDVANATHEQLTISWKGLGYYRRARNLQSACKFIAEHFQGQIPLHFESLIQIPGIGSYTANAIIAIGANQYALALDANLERVLSRFFGLKLPKGIKLQQAINQAALDPSFQNEVNKVGARAFNEALMDLGRNYCQARRAHCRNCFIQKNCVAFKNNQTLEIPVPVEKLAKDNHELTLLRLIVVHNESILVYPKSENEWLSGQYEVPTFVIKSTDPNLKQYPSLKEKDEFYLLPEFISGITKYKIFNKVLYLNRDELRELAINENDYEWMPLKLANNLSVATIKALQI
jgi:A/G-specific adenine glycosylase